VSNFVRTTVASGVAVLAVTSSPGQSALQSAGRSRSTVRRISGIVVSIFFWLALLNAAGAQLPLSSEDAKAIAPLFNASTHSTLKCWLERWNPSLDFAFRFVTGYVTNCRLSQFEGKKTVLVTYTRITPEGKPPSLFGSVYRLPEISPEMKEAIGGDLRNLNQDASPSGAFALGEGRYLVELLLQDDQKRSYRNRWRLHATIRRSERGVPLAVKPLTVESMELASWQTSSSERGGKLRLTILLDAAPLNRYQSSLRAWDRAFLLETVYSVLRQTPHKSVRLVAFNLDQQRELFRSDEFDNAAFHDLSRALKDVELSTVSVEAVWNRDSPKFLAVLADRELAAGSSDAIIFVGPNTRMDTQVTEGALTEKKANSPPLFYFEYFPWVGGDFPDSIDWLVKSAGGKVFLVHTPPQFDDSIDKMLAQLKQQ